MLICVLFDLKKHFELSTIPSLLKLKSKYLLVKLAVSNTATPEAVFKTLTLFGVLLLAPGWGSSNLVNNMMENQIQCRVSDYFSETER